MVVPLVVRLTVEGGVMVEFVVALTGKGGVVRARARADGRARRKARLGRMSFIVTVLKVVRLRKVVKK